MQAARLKEVDKDYRNHLQAFLNFSVQAQRKSGKKSVPVFKEFKKFFNYAKAIKEAQENEVKKDESLLSDFSKKFLKR